MSDLVAQLTRVKRIVRACENGGQINMIGLCTCPAYYHGSNCELIDCQHGGWQIGLSECKCPDSHIYGKFCEKVICENGGHLRDGYAKVRPVCECEETYSGRFCEDVLIPWTTILVLSVIALFITIFVIYAKYHISRKHLENRFRKLTTHHGPPHKLRFHQPSAAAAPQSPDSEKSNNNHKWHMKFRPPVLVGLMAAKRHKDGHKSEEEHHIQIEDTESPSVTFATEDTKVDMFGGGDNDRDEDDGGLGMMPDS